MNVIIRSPNWIGDCIMSIPAIKSLKYGFENTDIFIVTKPNLKNIFLSVKEISGIITISDNFSFTNIKKLSKKIKEFGIEEGILFTNSFSSALMLKLAGIKHLTGFRRDMRGFLLSNMEKFPTEILHQEDFYKRLISIFRDKVEKKDYSNEIFLTKSELKKSAELLDDMGVDCQKKIIGISPFTAYGSAKEWIPEYFVNLIKDLKKRFNCEIVLFGSPKEESKLRSLSENLQNDIHFVSSGFSLREAMIIISKLDFFIGNDSGLMHIASSFNIPLIGIFGPTLPEKSFPRNATSHLVYKEVDCSPCNHRECPIDHRCMRSIKPKEILEVVTTFIKS